MGESAFAAVTFMDRDLKIAALRSGEEIANDKCARRNIGFIDGVTVLANADAGIAVSDPADRGRETALAVRQHILIRGKLKPRKLKTVKNLARRVGIPYC